MRREEVGIHARGVGLEAPTERPVPPRRKVGGDLGSMLPDRQVRGREAPVQGPAAEQPQRAFLQRGPVDANL